ncbi:MAG TPA: zinc-binding alcohol dehydrogenase [Chloroflexi bacterium]|nr:zinc-binding alcohol dehydrogenase [Chloroflexota bacterium]
MIQAKAILFIANSQVVVDTVTLPTPGIGEVLVQAEYTCISPGTELRCLAGTVAEASPYPYIPGYSLAGRVAAVGEGCHTEVGARVWCTGTSRASVNLTWGGHVSHALVSEHDLTPIPDAVPMLDAAIGRLAAIAYHGVRLAQTQPHEKVAVVGLGPIGLLSALCHAATGAEVIVADRLPARVELAARVGLRGFVAEDSLADAFARFLPDGADVLVDATGLTNLAGALIPVGRMLAWDNTPQPRGARFVIQGSTDYDYVFPYLAAFDREMTFLLPRDRQPRDVAAVFDLMARGRLAVRPLISEVRPPADAAASYDDLRYRRERYLTIAFQWT